VSSEEEADAGGEAGGIAFSRVVAFADVVVGELAEVLAGEAEIGELVGLIGHMKIICFNSTNNHKLPSHSLPLHRPLEFLPQSLRHVLDGAQRIVEDVVGVLGEGLKPEVHFGLRGVGNAVADELDVGVS